MRSDLSIGMQIDRRRYCGKIAFICICRISQDVNASRDAQLQMFGHIISTLAFHGMASMSELPMATSGFKNFFIVANILQR
jgi:hypothetical protein